MSREAPPQLNLKLMASRKAIHQDFRRLLQGANEPRVFIDLCTRTIGKV